MVNDTFQVGYHKEKFRSGCRSLGILAPPRMSLHSGVVEANPTKNQCVRSEHLTCQGGNLNLESGLPHLRPCQEY